MCDGCYFVFVTTSHKLPDHQGVRLCYSGAETVRGSSVYLVVDKTTQ